MWFWGNVRRRVLGVGYVGSMGKLSSVIVGMKQTQIQKCTDQMCARCNYNIDIIICNLIYNYNR